VYMKVDTSLVGRRHQEWTRDEQTQTATPSTPAALERPWSPPHAAIIRDYVDCSREVYVLGLPVMSSLLTPTTVAGAGRLNKKVRVFVTLKNILVVIMCGSRQ